MPWEQTTVTEKKIEFVLAYRKAVKQGELSMAALCRQFKISRKTGYETVAAYETWGWRGLTPQSRAPRSGSHWADPDTIARVLEVRETFPEWGSKKIVAYLADIEPEGSWPAASTAQEWIRKAGLIKPRERVRRFSHPGRPPARAIERPNQQWSVDFKGHFRTKDRRYCYGLTTLDSYSRYLLGCEALQRPTFEQVWPAFERLFQEYGLPESILSDNGSPFSSTSVRRLSKLAVRWIRLGIRPVLIEPGKPQQNGRHERMHRDLKEIACARPAPNASQQQQQFDMFRRRYNELRPHEAHDQKPPSRFYAPSARRYPSKLPEMIYPDGLTPRRVRSSGEIKWDGQWFYIGDALIGETVGFEPVDNGCWIVRYGPIELGYYSAADKRLYLDETRPDGKAENK